MKHIYLRTGLKLFVIIVLLNIGIFAQSNLDSTRWALTEINGEKVKIPKAYLEINQTEKRFTGNASCNRMFGTVEISGRRIKFGLIGTTKMLCMKDGLMQTEREFLRALKQVTRFEKSGNFLKFYANGNLILKFKGTGKPSSDDDSAVKLEDKKWVLEAIKNKPLSKAENNAFLNFDKTKGSAGGNTSCNVFGGNYKTEGEKISFTNIISTMRACIEDGRMSVERGFLDGLQNANRYEISGEKLYLYRDKTLLLTFRAENK